LSARGEARHHEVVPLLLAAPDKYRGTLSGREAAEAVARAAEQAGWDCDVAPVSDGGEGFLDVFAGRGTLRRTRVRGPLGREVEAAWLTGSDELQPRRRWAVVESALASGLSLAGGADGNDPVGATTAGVGQLIAAAVAAGARQVIVGMGGSATTDGGLGAVEALAPPRLAGVELVVACDVQTKFLDAAAVFSSQKGATAAQVELLQRRLARVAQLYEARFGVNVCDMAGSGAAGGLAGGLAALGANLVPGFELVADRLELAERIAKADLVVTGEGYLDQQSFSGKAVGGVVNLAGATGVPVLVVAGDGEGGAPVPYVSLVETFGGTRAWSSTAACITEVVARRLASHGDG
jgi:glycerate kinase